MSGKILSQAPHVFQCTTELKLIKYKVRGIMQSYVTMRQLREQLGTLPLDYLRHGVRAVAISCRDCWNLQYSLSSSSLVIGPCTFNWILGHLPKGFISQLSLLPCDYVPSRQMQVGCLESVFRGISASPLHSSSLLNGVWSMSWDGCFHGRSQVSVALEATIWTLGCGWFLKREK